MIEETTERANYRTECKYYMNELCMCYSGTCAPGCHVTFCCTPEAQCRRLKRYDKKQLDKMTQEQYQEAVTLQRQIRESRGYISQLESMVEQINQLVKNKRDIQDIVSDKSQSKSNKLLELFSLTPDNALNILHDTIQSEENNLKEIENKFRMI
jgi:TolA-binding protein